LIPHLRGVRSFAEPCCGEGDLVQHLESFGLTCAYAGDLATGQDALKLTAADYNGADVGITNPPFRYPQDPERSTRLLRDLIRHFLEIGIPHWLLIPHDWSANKRSASHLRACSDIVPVGRVKWIPDSEHNGGMDNSAWCRFDARHSGCPVLHARDLAPMRAARCAQCHKSYAPQRSSSRFCSPACRQGAYRARLSITLSVTLGPSDGRASP
jgi:hypothetical protein